MANVRDVNDFVEQLSNCIGEISGDEVVLKKIPYSSEYVVRMRNHNEKVANIWYDYDKDKIIVQLIPAFRNMEYSIDDLTIDTIKGIGQMVRKNALNRIGESMGIDEAQQILNENGYLLESHVQGHCANCGEELWSDEAWNEYKGKRYCDSCYEKIARPKGKFREAEIYFKDLDTKQTNNVGIEIRDCLAKTKKAAKEYAIKKFQDKIYDGFYDSVNMLKHTRERRYRNIKIMKVELY